jgi:RNA polymerase sigma-70 factor (ECF subfamily)
VELTVLRSSEHILPLDEAESPRSARRPSFHEVYRQHFDFVWRLARARRIPLSAVEDVVQEVFLVVHRQLPSFEGRSSLKTWLYTITRRVARDYARKRGNKVVGEEMKNAVATEEPGPESQAARNEAAQVLATILDGMDDVKREVFVLSEMEGMSGAEIAEALDVNPNTVYSRLRAAKAEFSAAVARHRAQWRFRSGGHG